MSYLSRPELEQLLRNDWFTNPMSMHVHNYHNYRGRTNANVLTLRFNMNVNFNEDNMIESVIQTTINHFSSQQTVLGLIEYDLLLMQPDPESFYIWRANSNISRNIPNAEQTLRLNYDNLFLFARNAARVIPTDLEAHFRTSNVIINRVIAIVFTFISSS
jgi:hypothetical protein